MFLLCTCCTSLLVFILSDLQAPASPWPLASLTALQHVRELLCCAGVGVPSAPWQVLVPVQNLVARPPEDAVWGCVMGDPSRGVVPFGRQSEHRVLLGRQQGELGWAEVVWVLSRT